VIPKTETSADDAAEEWSTPVNWEETLSLRQNVDEEDTVLVKYSL